jgi:hypothetical protein
MHLRKKLALASFALCLFGATFAAAPSFDDNFANYLTDATPDAYGRVETVFSLCVDRNVSLMENVKNLFYPSTTVNPNASAACKNQWWQLWILIRNLSIILMFVFLVLAGVNFIMKAKDPEWPKKSASSLMYIAYGAFLIFGVIRILWTVLNLPNIQWTTQLVDRIQNNLFLQILTFFKVLWFFIAIVMMVVYGIRMMAAMDKDEKLKIAKTGILNIIIALVLIKVIDYIFFIAQAPTFATKAADLIVQVAIIAGYVLGALFVAAIFYAWFLFITSSGNEEATKKAKSAIINILIVALVVFLFLLITYQIFNEFV